MGQNSKIAWCDHTFNPWIGCAKVSPGCAHCYAEVYGNRFGIEWGPSGLRRRTSPANWKEPLKWNADRWYQCHNCGWRGSFKRTGVKASGELTCPECDSVSLDTTRQRVFCASLADVFEANPQLADWRLDLFELIHLCPNLDWLLLTKRPENLHGMMPSRWLPHKFGRPPRHVWFGISAENQDEFDSRWPVLEHFGRLFGAAKLFISAEPLLGPINMESALKEDHGDEEDPYQIRAVDWVIVGGESGPKARPMHPGWARSIRDQCVAAGAAFHFKQWGEFVPWGVAENMGFTTKHSVMVLQDGRVFDYGDAPELGWQMTRVGKDNAGRRLDGREWNESPESVTP